MTSPATAALLLLALASPSLAAQAADSVTLNLANRPAFLDHWPAQLTGELLDIRGFDAAHSQAVAILRLPDGRTRSVPSGLLDDAGRAALAERLARREKTPPATGPARTFVPGEYDPATDAAAVNIHQTDHFAFHFGNNKQGSGRAFFDDPAFLDRITREFEHTWAFFRDTLKSPLPGSDHTPPRKLNVYITGTGLPKHAEGFAFAAEAIIMHPAALGPGSGVIPHEFAHTVQLAAGGYRNSEFVGWFWECHANWAAHQMFPAWTPALEVYAERAHYELTSSRMNYGSWPFLQLLTEHPDFGPDFCFHIWTANRKNARDRSIEDPIQTIIRLIDERNTPGRSGITTFGDLIGELGWRMFNWEFVHQLSYQHSLGHHDRARIAADRTRTVLLPSDAPPEPDGARWFRPFFSQSPRAFGINLIDIQPLPGATSVSAELRPLTDIQGADWRATLVVVDQHGRSRVSPTVRVSPGATPGTLTVDLQPDDRRVGLAVCATPSIYSPVPFRPGYGRKARYPYEVALRNAQPATAPCPAPTLAALHAGQRPPGKPHPNGGGFVADTATVAPSAFVAPSAAVLGNAVVADNARILGSALVRDHARVTDNAVIADHAVVADHAQVRGNARVRHAALIADRATLTDDARATEFIHIRGNGTIRDRAFIRGFGEIHTAENTTLGGTVTAGEDLEVHLSSVDRPRIDTGMLYGFVTDGQIRTDLQDNNALFARWTFDQPGRRTLPDAIGDTQGWLRNQAEIVSIDDRTWLRPGTDGYAAIEPHPADTAELTIHALVRRTESHAGEIIAFSGENNARFALQIAADGVPEALLSVSGKPILLRAARALTLGETASVTLAASAQALTLWINIEAPTRAPTSGLTPAHIEAHQASIARGLPGLLADLRLYRTAFAEPAQLPPAP